MSPETHRPLKCPLCPLCLTLGAAHYKLTTKKFPIFPEGVRMRDLHKGVPLAATTRFHLEPEVRLKLQELCAFDSAVFRPVMRRRVKVQH